MTSKREEQNINVAKKTDSTVGHEIGLAGLMEQRLARYINADRDVLPSSGLYDRVMNEVERPLLRLVLDVVNGNQKKAADILGINRNTLHKKMKFHGLLKKRDDSSTRRRGT